MQYIDLVGAMAASRHAAGDYGYASMDHLDFVAPVHVGEFADFEGQCETGRFKTSMEVG